MADVNLRNLFLKETNLADSLERFITMLSKRQ